jgi:hypothetical protein
MTLTPKSLFAALLASSALFFAAGCSPAPKAPASSSAASRAAAHAKTDYTSYLRAQPIGAPISQPPWIAHVKAFDLDGDGLLDVLAAECQENKIVWIRQTSPGNFEEITLAENLEAPVRVEVADMNGDGHPDLLVAVMGYVFPNNDKIGSVVILENDGRQNFTPHRILERTSRVTDVRAADFDGDGRMDLALAQFGYDQGEIRWLQRTGPWQFKEHVLLDLSGAINVCIDDYTGDGRPDIVALISQQWEEIYLFENKGNGVFARKRIWGSTNEDYGSSGISSADLDRDGRPDILYTNGDGFGPAALPGPRPWHGVQWLQNKGGGNFTHRRIGDLPGAYSPVAADLDGDGHLDVVAVSAYSDWDRKDPHVVSLMWYRNDGRMNFTPRVLAYTPKDQITLDVGDFLGRGRPSLVSGGFYIFAPHVNMGRVTLWNHASDSPTP